MHRSNGSRSRTAETGPTTSAPRRARRRALALGLIGAAMACAAPATAGAATQLSGWGNGAGLGIGSTAVTPRTAQVAGIDGATAVAVGEDRSLALTPAGVLSTGTTNSATRGGLGLVDDAGDLAAALRWTPLPGTADVTAVAAGSDASLLLRSDGTVWSFGRNQYGAAGEPFGTPAESVWRLAPRPVAGLADVTAIATAYRHSLALEADGDVWAWGLAARLGNESQTTNTGTPVKVSLPGPAVQIAAGHTHSLALLRNGEVWAWGANAQGQLGDETTVARVAPVKVHGLDGLTVASVSAGNLTSFALLDDGTFRAWGYNGAGSLGLASGSAANLSIPTAPTTSSVPASYPRLKRISAVGYTTYGLTESGGLVYAWGRNDSGEVGAATPWYAFPYTGAPGTAGQLGTEVPQRVGVLRNVPWLAVGGSSKQQLVQTDQTLRRSDAVSDDYYYDQQLGTVSGAQAVWLIADADVRVTSVRLEGADALDFFFDSGAGNVFTRLFPIDVPIGREVSFYVRFAPSAVGERRANLVVSTEDETVKVPLVGHGVPFAGGPKGDKGETVVGPPGPPGPAGANGRDGASGAIVIAPQAVAAVRRGGTAALRFSLSNRTGGRFAGASLAATPPTALRVSGRRTVALAPLGAGARRTVTLRLKVGAKAKLGTHRVKVALRLAGRAAVTQTVSVRVR